MKTLILNSNKIALVDDEDYQRLSIFSWFEQGTNIQRCGYVDGKKCNISLACEILQDYASMFDHKDRNYLNNQRSNLRRCDGSLNQFNVSKRVGDLSSKFKGVSWNKGVNKWTAYIKHKRKKIHLGCFTEEKEAALAYNLKASELVGEFAFLNVL